MSKVRRSADGKFLLGGGATLCYWSDRRAATVIDLSPSGKVVTIREDRAIRTDDRGMSEHQDYRYEPNPDGRVLRFSLRSSGRWVRVGEPQQGGLRLAPGRHEFYDFTF